MTVRLPPFAPGQTIGLLGGTFDPPHAGHRLISELALRRLRLDRLWWLVTPGNPLKETGGLAATRARVAAARRLTRDPRIAVTGFEAEIGSRYTYQTIAWLSRRAPGVRFVWIMGADNLSQFHLWRRWREIADLAPIVVVDRPGSTLRALAGRAGAALAPLPPPGGDGGALRPAAAARLPVSARAALRPVVDGAQARRRPVTLCLEMSIVAAHLSPMAARESRGRAERKSTLTPKRETKAPPRRRKAPPSPAPIRPRDDRLPRTILASLENSKAEDVVAIDVAGKTTLADTMIVATGRSNVHVGAIADHLAKAVRAAGYPTPRLEGLPNCDWVLLDAGDAIVHIFRPEVRQFYNLEKLWSADRPRELQPARAG